MRTPIPRDLKRWVEVGATTERKLSRPSDELKQPCAFVVIKRRNARPEPLNGPI